MRFCAFFLLIAVLLGCNQVRPSTAASPAPLPSAAQPAVTGRGDQAYARRSAEAIRAALQELEPEQTLTKVVSAGIVAAKELAVGCVSAAGPVPVLLCQFGPTRVQPFAQAIFWYDVDTWRFQLYPQARPSLAGERLESLSGRNCQVGCQGAFVQARQSSGETAPELLVVVNLSAGLTVPAEEVQVLRLVDDAWEVAWVPGGGDWNYGHARVSLAETGIARFRVRSSSWTREDMLAGYFAEPEAGEHRRFADRWERVGGTYILRDRVEEATPYGALQRAVHYLSTGADEKARDLLAGSVPLEQARKALAQKPRRQGWKVRRTGESTFALDTQNDGKPDQMVRLEQVKGRWLLAEVQALNPTGSP